MRDIRVIGLTKPSVTVVMFVGVVEGVAIVVAVL